MTSAFAQHKLVQKPSKQHRFDCLASKLHRVAHQNYNDTSDISAPNTQCRNVLGPLYLGVSLTVLILSIISFIISYSFDGYKGLGLYPFFYNFALMCLRSEVSVDHHLLWIL